MIPFIFFVVAEGNGIELATDIFFLPLTNFFIRRLYQAQGELHVLKYFDILADIEIQVAKAILFGKS